MNRKFYIGLGIAFTAGLLFLLIYGLFFASNPREIPSSQLGRKAYPFSVETFDGKPISLEQFRGKPVVLNFWASWCIACRREAHILESAHQRYTPKGAVFIGIPINDSRAATLGIYYRFW